MSDNKSREVHINPTKESFRRSYVAAVRALQARPIELRGPFTRLPTDVATQPREGVAKPQKTSPKGEG